MSEYNFSEWGIDRLLERQQILLEVDQVPHPEPRASLIARELMHITFEIEWISQHGK